MQHEHFLVLSILLILLCILAACSSVIVDSDLTKHEAIHKNQPPDTPVAVQMENNTISDNLINIDSCGGGRCPR